MNLKFLILFVLVCMVHAQRGPRPTGICQLQFASRRFNWTDLQLSSPFTATDPTKPTWNYAISLCNPLDIACGANNQVGFFAVEQYSTNTSSNICIPLSTRVANEVEFERVPIAGGRQDQFVITFNNPTTGRGNQRQRIRTRVILICDPSATTPILTKTNEQYLGSRLIYTFNLNSSLVCVNQTLQTTDITTEEGVDTTEDEDPEYALPEDNMVTEQPMEQPMEPGTETPEQPMEQPMEPGTETPEQPMEQPATKRFKRAFKQLNPNVTFEIPPLEVPPINLNPNLTVVAPPITPPGQNRTNGTIPPVPAPPITPPGRTNETRPVGPPITPPGRNRTELNETLGVPPEEVPPVEAPPITPPGRTNETRPVGPPITPPGRNETRPPITPPGRNQTRPVGPPITPPGRNRTQLFGGLFNGECWSSGGGMNDYAPFAYDKIGNRVFLSGVFNRDPRMPNQSNIICVLPEGYRPNATVLYATTVEYVNNEGTRKERRESSIHRPNMIMVYTDGRILLANPLQPEGMFDNSENDNTDNNNEDMNGNNGATQYVTVDGVNFGV